MDSYRVEAAAEIDAPPSVVYTIISDYKTHHPAILPKPYFTDLIVQEGGRGAGTVAEVRMEVLGVKQVYWLKVTEPEPGRVLKEADDGAGVVTYFTADPLDDGRRSRLTIATDMPARGLRGFVERLINPPIMRRIYRAELDNIAAYAVAHRQELESER